MEKKKLTELEEEQIAGGEIIIHEEALGRTRRIICPKCNSRNLEFENERLDDDYHPIKEGKLNLSARDFLKFISHDDYRYRMTCRDCGYNDYAMAFKQEYVKKQF